MTNKIILYLKLEKLDSSLFYIDILLQEKLQHGQFNFKQLEKNLWLNTETIELQYELDYFTDANLIIKLIHVNKIDCKLLLHDFYLKHNNKVKQLLMDTPIYRHMQRHERLKKFDVKTITGAELKKEKFFHLENNTVQYIFDNARYIYVGNTKIIEINDQFQLDFNTIS